MEAKAIHSMTAPAACVDCCGEQRLRQHRGRLSEGDEKQGLTQDSTKTLLETRVMGVPANEGTTDSRTNTF